MQGAYLAVSHTARGGGETDSTRRTCVPQPSAIARVRNLCKCNALGILRPKPDNACDDYVFASIKMHGKQPIWPSSAMEIHIRPAAKRAGITKRIGWHTLGHTFGTLLKANAEDVATVQALMRHANLV